MNPSFPEKIGQWCITRDRLGDGTYAMVLLARHEKIPGFRAAVKVICRSQLSRSFNFDDDFSGKAATSFIRRVVALMKIIAHERVVKLYDFYEYGDQIYMLLEHAQNNSLRHVLAHNIMVPPRVVIEIFLQLVQGVAHLHSLYIAHRDLKPENILVFGPNVLNLLKGYSFEPKNVDVKLSDFDLSHMVNPKLLSSLFSGTPRAQPPEIHARVPHRPFPTDIWSLGVILYELLYNDYPFEKDALIDYGKLFLPLARIPHLAIDAPVPKAGKTVYAPFITHSTPGNLNGLLKWIFMLDPADRPTAQDILAHPYFSTYADRKISSTPHAALAFQPFNDDDLAHGDCLFDIARLHVDHGFYLIESDQTRIPCEGAVLALLRRADQNDLHVLVTRMWMRNLLAYSADRVQWEAAWKAAPVPHKLVAWFINRQIDKRTVMKTKTMLIPRHRGFPYLKQGIRAMWPFKRPALQRVDQSEAHLKAQKKSADRCLSQPGGNLAVSTTPPLPDTKHGTGTMLDFVVSKKRGNPEEASRPSVLSVDFEGMHTPHPSQVSTISTRTPLIQFDALIRRSNELRFDVPALLRESLDVVEDVNDDKKALTHVLDAIEATRWIQ